MKTLHINSYYANRFFYKNLIDAQIQMGNEVRTIIPAEFEFRESIEYDSNVSIVKAYPRKMRFIYPVRFSKILNKIDEEIKVRDYDVIHAHSLFTNGYIAQQLSKKYDIPYCVTVRNIDINGFFRYGIPLRQTGRRIINNSGTLLFLSNAFMNILKEKYYKNLDLEKCKVVPNGIDKFWIENIAVEGKKIDKSNITFIYAGEINKNKNITSSAEAIKQFRCKTNASVRFIVVGKVVDQEVKKRLESYDFVNLRGPIEKEKLIDLYRSSDIYIMPSFTESFGLTYVEAMSQGLPVIYSAGQGFDGQFEEGVVGFHVNSRSVEDITNKIEQVITLYSELSTNGAAAAKEFSWSDISKKYQLIYNQMLNERKNV